MQIKIIKIDFNDIKSIERAEKQKARLENQGYTMIKPTEKTGQDKFISTYGK